MFTGLIEAVCTVKSVRRFTDTIQLCVDLGQIADGIKTGDSIAVNGACLTVADIADSVAAFDVSAETLTKSTLGRLDTGSRVNVEQAVRADSRFGGHIVTGHVDAAAAISSIDRQGEFANITFTGDDELLRQMVVKGSVAVDGISLTIAAIDNGTFTAAIIPQTLSKTTLGAAKIGERVNIEIDIITKTVKKQLENILPKQEKLTMEKLRQLGF